MSSLLTVIEPSWLGSLNFGASQRDYLHVYNYFLNSRYVDKPTSVVLVSNYCKFIVLVLVIMSVNNNSFS